MHTVDSAPLAVWGQNMLHAILAGSQRPGLRVWRNSSILIARTPKHAEPGKNARNQGGGDLPEVSNLATTERTPDRKG